MYDSFSLRSSNTFESRYEFFNTCSIYVNSLVQDFHAVFEQIDNWYENGQNV